MGQTDFYSYCYFASEGFLPGYSFPRLPLAAFEDAARAMVRYATIHAESRARAADALRMYQPVLTTGSLPYSAWHSRMWFHSWI